MMKRDFLAYPNDDRVMFLEYLNTAVGLHLKRKKEKKCLIERMLKKIALNKAKNNFVERFERFTKQRRYTEMFN